MLKITNLVDSMDVVDLQESETNNIIGGAWPSGEACSPRGAEIIVDRNKFRCVDRFLWSRDEWEFVGDA
jgi:hypothetical protein